MIIVITSLRQSLLSRQRWHSPSASCHCRQRGSNRWQKSSTSQKSATISIRKPFRFVGVGCAYQLTEGLSPCLPLRRTQVCFGITQTSSLPAQRWGMQLAAGWLSLFAADSNPAAAIAQQPSAPENQRADQPGCQHLVGNKGRATRRQAETPKWRPLPGRKGLTKLGYLANSVRDFVRLFLLLDLGLYGQRGGGILKSWATEGVSCSAYFS
jgi:hypothetical protein